MPQAFQPDYYLSEAVRELQELVGELNAYQIPPMTPQLHQLLTDQVVDVRDRAATLLFEVGPQQGELWETPAI
jgi:hypothetical protein